MLKLEKFTINTQSLLTLWCSNRLRHISNVDNVIMIANGNDVLTGRPWTHSRY